MGRIQFFFNVSGESLVFLPLLQVLFDKIWVYCFDGWNFYTVSSCFINIYSDSVFPGGCSFLEVSVHVFLKYKQIGIQAIVLCSETAASFCHFLHRDKLLVGKAWRLLRKWIDVTRELKERRIETYLYQQVCSFSNQDLYTRKENRGSWDNTTDTGKVGLSRLEHSLRGMEKSNPLLPQPYRCLKQVIVWVNAEKYIEEHSAGTILNWI